MTTMWACRTVALLALAAAVQALPSGDHAEQVVLDANQNQVNYYIKESVMQAPVPVSPRPDTPINEQYPHAVLFGGSCGGSIISPTWILTAAHCTIFTSGRWVLAGTNHTRQGGVSREVKRLIVHPRFSVGPYWLRPQDFGIRQVGARWDFMLAELETPLPLNGRTLAAVVLPAPGALPAAGLVAHFAGFGAAKHGASMRRQMHAMELAALEPATCSDLPEFDADDMLCTRGTEPSLDSACNGDSGSGLVGGGALLGVASWVEDDAVTCHRGARVVFSRVAAVRDWIRQVTAV